MRKIHFLHSPITIKIFRQINQSINKHSRTLSGGYGEKLNLLKYVSSAVVNMAKNLAVRIITYVCSAISSKISKYCTRILTEDTKTLSTPAKTTTCIHHNTLNIQSGEKDSVLSEISHSSPPVIQQDTLQKKLQAIKPQDTTKKKS